MKDLIKTDDNLALDRLQLKENVEENLLRFVNLQMQKLSKEDRLKKSVLEALEARVADEETSDVVLIKLLEILSKSDNDMAISILDIVKNNNKGNNNNSDSDIPVGELSQEQKSDLTKDDVKEIKDLLKTLDNVKKSEF